MTDYLKGALVYLPAGIRLYQFQDEGEGGAVDRYRDIAKPTSVLLVEESARHSPYCSIIYGGEKWAVLQREIYPQRLAKNE